MKFSIIVPIYNAAKYLPQCLKSLIKQTETNFEVILVDDGSSDESPYICDKFAKIDTRFKVIHQQNGGVSAARNSGLKVAQGEWLCFVDADDEVEAQWLENFAKNITDNIDIIIQGALVIEETTTRTIQFPHRIYSRNNITELISYWQHKEPDMGSLWTKAIRSSLVKKTIYYLILKLSTMKIGYSLLIAFYTLEI